MATAFAFVPNRSDGTMSRTASVLDTCRHTRYSDGHCEGGPNGDCKNYYNRCTRHCFSGRNNPRLDCTRES